MILNLDLSSQTPIYAQLRNQIVLGIGQGKLKNGESLPTVRQLAADTGINSMTVNKAYQILRAEGFIEIDRRHGARVSPTADRHGEFREKLTAELELLVAESEIKGVGRAEFLALCERLYDTMQGAQAASEG